MLVGNIFYRSLTHHRLRFKLLVVVAIPINKRQTDFVTKVNALAKDLENSYSEQTAIQAQTYSYILYQSSILYLH